MLPKDYDEPLSQAIVNIIRLRPGFETDVVRKTEEFARLHCSLTPPERQTKTWKRLHIKNVENYKYDLSTALIVRQINRTLQKFGRLILLLYRNPRLCLSTFNRLKEKIPLTCVRVLIPPDKLHRPPYPLPIIRPI